MGRSRKTGIFLLSIGVFCASAGTAAELQPPAVATLVKPSVLKRVVDDRDVMSHASLEDNRYSYYAVMQVGASVEKTHKILTDYKLYSEMIPYIHHTDYDSAHGILSIQGGIWKFFLSSLVKFEEKSPRWVHYQVIGGHFQGLAGDIYFEPLGESGEKGTLVYLGGSQTGTKWPPKFIIERGAEIVFEFTAKRMRSYIETKKDAGKEGPRPNDNQIPQPRSHL